MEHTERVQLQYPSGAPVCMPARTRTKTRGNPDRGARVPATKLSFLPRGAARRLHTVARDGDVPRPSSPRQMCARSCRVRACRLHRCPEGLLHPAVHLAFGCEMPKTTAQHSRPHRDGSAQQDGSLQRPGHGRHFQLSRSRPAAPWRELGRLHVAPGGASDFGPEVGHPSPGVSGPHKATLGPRAAGAGAPLRVRPGQGFPPPCRRGHARFWSLCDAGAVPSTRAADALGDCIAAEQILVKC